jgi:hypothetical protein
MPGATAYGFHEGSRSEYLAQYAFASWGTAVAIPHQEDHGIDLTCTLMERVGSRYLAQSPYTVQVKSGLEPLVYEGEAVRWLVHHPLPLYLCVVDKASARLSVYHTFPRFYTWTLGTLPPKVEMTPAAVAPGRTARNTQWAGSYSFDLDQPILDFTIGDMMDDTFWKKARKVFEYWVGVENDNLTRIRAHLPTFRMPGSYRTNDDWVGSWVELSLSFPEEEQRQRATSHLKQSLEWVGDQLRRRGDASGAVKAAMLHRHLFPEDVGGVLSSVRTMLNKHFGRRGYWFAGVDRLAELVAEALREPNAAVQPKAE